MVKKIIIVFLTAALLAGCVVTVIIRDHEEARYEVSTADYVHTDNIDSDGTDMADTIRSSERSEESEVNWDGLFRANGSDSGSNDHVDVTYRQEEVGKGVEQVDESEYTDVDSSADYSSDTWADAWVDSEADTDYSESVTAMTPPQTDTHYGFTDDEVYEIARIVWLEVGICGCSYYTQYLTTCVILNRYLDWGYDSLYATIHADGQYATADMYTEYDGSSIRIGERTWSAVYDALADTDRNPHYQMRKGYEQRVYYSDPDWDVCFYY